MEDLMTLILKYGWQISLLGVIGSALIGLIKTPIKALVFKKLSDPEKIKKMESIFDTSVFIFSFILAGCISAIYLLIAKDFNWQAMAGTTIQTWLTQSVVYGIWKKLGLKRLLMLIVTSIKNVFIKHMDKNKDGKVEFTEALDSIKSLMSNGKLDLDKVLSKADELAPGLVNEILLQVTTEAEEAGQIDPVKELDKLTNVIQDTVDIASEKVKDIAPDSIDKVVDLATDALSDVISDIPKIKF